VPKRRLSTLSLVVALAAAVLGPVAAAVIVVASDR
jgi:hypothetical protein